MLKFGDPTLIPLDGDKPRTGHRVRIVEAGDGLFATRHFRKHEHILDYRFKNGIRRPGDEVDWLTRE